MVKVLILVCQLTIAALFIYAGIYPIKSGLESRRRVAEILAVQRSETEGTVREILHELKSRAGRNVGSRVRMSFTTDKGQEISIEKSLYADARAGMKMPIRYDPDNPMSNSLGAERMSPSDNLVRFIFGGGLIMIGLAILAKTYPLIRSILGRPSQG